MKLRTTALVLACLAVGDHALPARAAESAIYVDCAAPPGGDGSKGAPLPTISSALPVARGLAAKNIVIDVAEGICSRETFPIVLNFSVWLKGSRAPLSRDDERPDGRQERDTLVTGSSSTGTFFLIAADHVTISHLSLDGGLSLGPDGQIPQIMIPLGVSAIQVRRYALRHMRIVGMAQVLRSEGSSGQVANNYVSAWVGPFFSGGSAQASPAVHVTQNYVEYRINGIPISGAGMFGEALRIWVTNNEFATPFTNTGPTNPAGIRLSPMVAAATTPGRLEAFVEDNDVSGPAKYGVVVHAGQPTRRTDGGSYSGIVIGRFVDTSIDGASHVGSLVTFTNLRATAFPCELDPLSTRVACPTLQGPPAGPFVFHEYLTNSNFALVHTGELDGVLIDHPQFHPIDGYPLNNVLQLNREVVDYQTFVVVP